MPLTNASRTSTDWSRDSVDTTVSPCANRVFRVKASMSGCTGKPSNAATRSTFVCSGISVASKLSTTVALYLMLPQCRRAASNLRISQISLSENNSTFMAERMSANSAASSRPSHTMQSPPVKYLNASGNRFDYFGRDRNTKLSMDSPVIWGIAQFQFSLLFVRQTCQQAIEYMIVSFVFILRDDSRFLQ